MTLGIRNKSMSFGVKAIHPSERVHPVWDLPRAGHGIWQLRPDVGNVTRERYFFFAAVFRFIVLRLPLVA